MPEDIANIDMDAGELWAALDRAGSARDKVLVCLALFQRVYQDMDRGAGLDFPPADKREAIRSVLLSAYSNGFNAATVGKFIGLPEDIVESVLVGLKAEGLIG